MYCRGIALIKQNKIAIGTSSGTILIFEIPSKGSNITQIAELHEKSLVYGINDLASSPESEFLAAADTKGNLGVWSLKGDSPKLAYILHDCTG